MTQIQLGFCMPIGAGNKAERATFVEDLDRAMALITGHFDSAWFVDHVQFGDADVLEGFTALTYMAARHPQLKFGHLVLCQSFRNPTLLAKMGATLQFMSGGRFIFGLGAGWHEEEYRAYGYDYPPAGVRVAQFGEAVQIIKAMWTEEKATFEGNYYRVSEAYCEPKPEPVPPFLIGAFQPKMLRLAAKYADIWNVSFNGIDKYRLRAEGFERACAEVGRDPATVRRSWFGGCVCAPTQAEVEALTRADFNPANNFAGTPEQVIAQMRPFIELGVDYFMLGCEGFPKLTTLEMLVQEVLPALNDE